MFAAVKEKIGHLFSSYLNKKLPGYTSFAHNDLHFLSTAMKPGDILLVEGNTRVSSVIKYLTQSTWSHAAFYAGEATGIYTDEGEQCPLIEAELAEGVIASPLSKYRSLNIRICRPVNLTRADRDIVVKTMVDSLGKQYDLKHILDLARYLIPIPIPSRFRRRMLALGSGEPTRAICSSLLAETFQSIRYPILPIISRQTIVSTYYYEVKETYEVRHYSLFTPRDFDISPYFEIIKPTLARGFNYQNIQLVGDQNITSSSNAVDHKTKT